MDNFVLGIFIMSTLATIGTLIHDKEKKRPLPFLLGPIAWIITLGLLIATVIENRKILESKTTDGENKKWKPMSCGI